MKISIKYSFLAHLVYSVESVALCKENITDPLVHTETEPR